MGPYVIKGEGEESTMVRIFGCNYQTLGPGVPKIQCNNPLEVPVRNCLSTQKSLKCPGGLTHGIICCRLDLDEKTLHDLLVALATFLAKEVAKDVASEAGAALWDCA